MGAPIVPAGGLTAAPTETLLHRIAEKGLLIKPPRLPSLLSGKRSFCGVRSFESNREHDMQRVEAIRLAGTIVDVLRAAGLDWVSIDDVGRLMSSHCELAQREEKPASLRERPVLNLIEGKFGVPVSAAGSE